MHHLYFVSFLCFSSLGIHSIVESNGRSSAGFVFLPVVEAWTTPKIYISSPAATRKEREYDSPWVRKDMSSISKRARSTLQLSLLPTDETNRLEPSSRSNSTDPQLPKNGKSEEPSPKLPIGTIASRIIDTVEDAVVHLKRVPYDFGWLPEINSSPDDTRPTIVVLGSGWAAHALLKVADTTKLRLVVISPTNHFVFTPMLASASVGTVEYRSMTEAVRAANPLIYQYIEGTATDVNVNQQTVTVQLSSLLTSTRLGEPAPVTIRYDKLVVAVGSKVNDSLVKGAAQYCLRLKSCEDARKLRNAIGECLEYASRPDVADDPSLDATERAKRAEERRQRVTFCIIGGGPTGCELAGELSDFFRDTTRPRVGVFAKLRGDIQIVLIHGGSELVQQFDPDLRTHALKSLRKQGVDVRLNTYVEECGDGFIRLKDKFTGDFEDVPSGLTVFAAGVGAVRFVETLLKKLPSEAKGPNGRVFVDKWMRCQLPETAGFGSVLVLGDAAAFGNDISQGFLPQTAQVAGQQGAFIARLLDRGYDLTMTPPMIPKNDSSPMAAWLRFRNLESAAGFDFLNLGLLAYVGGSEALSQVEIGDVPILSYAGSISFILWRSVYLVKQVATRNRVLVTFDWIKSFIFGRDVTRL